MNLNRSMQVAVAAMGLAAASACAADTTVYRCVESGRVLYTDFPCRNAAKLEIDPGKADPAATRRLAEAQAALDAGMVQWRADDARDAARQEALAAAREAARAAAPPEPQPVADDYWPIYGGYVGPVRPRPRPHHAVPPRHDRHGMTMPPANGKPPRPPRVEPRTR